MNNLKNKIQIMVEKNEEPLLQNIWHEVQNHLMCAMQQVEHIMNLHGSAYFLGYSLQQ